MTTPGKGGGLFGGLSKSASVRETWFRNELNRASQIVWGRRGLETYSHGEVEAEEDGVVPPKHAPPPKRERRPDRSALDGFYENTSPFSGQKNHNYFGAIMFRSGLG